MNKINEMRIDFFATEENVAFARAAVSAFLLPLNPTLEELEDVNELFAGLDAEIETGGYR